MKHVPYDIALKLREKGFETFVKSLKEETNNITGN
jgi:hypothetical protein